MGNSPPPSHGPQASTPEPGRRVRRRVAESDDEDEGPVHDQDFEVPSDEEEGEDLMENIQADYEAIPELDRYDPTLLDKRQYDEMTAGASELSEAGL